METKTHKTKCYTNTGYEFAVLMDEQTKSGKGHGLLKVMKQINVGARNRAQFFCLAQAPYILDLTVSPEAAGRPTELAQRYFQALQPIS